MRHFTVFLLACGIGLAGGLSCASHQAPSSTSQPPASQAQTDAKAKKDKDAELRAQTQYDRAMALAAAKAKKDKDAADAKALAKAKARMSNPPAPKSAGPPANPNVPLTTEQQLNDLNRRYINNEISPLQYQIERAKILSGP